MKRKPASLKTSSIQSFSMMTTWTYRTHYNGPPHLELAGSVKKELCDFALARYHWHNEPAPEFVDDPLRREIEVRREERVARLALDAAHRVSLDAYLAFHGAADKTPKLRRAKSGADAVLEKARLRHLKAEAALIAFEEAILLDDKFLSE